MGSRLLLSCCFEVAQRPTPNARDYYAVLTQGRGHILNVTNYESRMFGLPSANLPSLLSCRLTCPQNQISAGRHAVTKRDSKMMELEDKNNLDKFYSTCSTPKACAWVGPDTPENSIDKKYGRNFPQIREASGISVKSCPTPIPSPGDIYPTHTWPSALSVRRLHRDRPVMQVVWTSLTPATGFAIRHRLGPAGYDDSCGDPS